MKSPSEIDSIFPGPALSVANPKICDISFPPWVEEKMMAFKLQYGHRVHNTSLIAGRKKRWAFRVVPTEGDTTDELRSYLVSEYDGFEVIVEGP
jgi:hypothetical protein